MIVRHMRSAHLSVNFSASSTSERNRKKQNSINTQIIEIPTNHKICRDLFGKENPRLSRGFKKALAMERKRPPVL